MHRNQGLDKDRASRECIATQIDRQVFRHLTYQNTETFAKLSLLSLIILLSMILLYRLTFFFTTL